MERVGTLINKLQEQFASQQSADKLLQTTQMLLAELQQTQKTDVIGKVAVIMPFNSAIIQDKDYNTTVESIESDVESVNVIHEVEPTLSVVTEPIAEVPIQPTLVEQITLKEAVKDEATVTHAWLFDPIVPNIPTIDQHVEKETPLVEKPLEKEVFELKDVLYQEENQENLNDKLKENKTEIAAILQGSPVKDLRKAIGINDRYLFINELFRGDENMYERSIKTINSFNIYPEAEYWIQRELKVKLGWIEDHEAVKIFDQLVKRRFS